MEPAIAGDELVRGFAGQRHRAMAHVGGLEIKPGDGTYVRVDNDLAASLACAAR